MPRPLRVEYPNAWYHVMNRGRRRERIYRQDADYENFLKLLQETGEHFDLRVSAYCLMPNHYHLLVQTPHANLSRCMRHLNGVYTQRYNRAHRCDSQLFQGRYKAIVIEEDPYLLEVLRYIHRNPINARLEKTLGTYPWSSHRGYLSTAKLWSWLNKDPLLRYFSSQQATQKRLYASFVAKKEPENIRKLYQAKKYPPVVGSDAYVQQIRKEYLEALLPHEFPELKALAPSEETVFSKVCRQYRIAEEALFQSKRGKINEARDVAIFLISDLCYAPYQQIAETFGVSTPSAISSAKARVKEQMKNDSRFFKKLQRLKKNIKTI